MDHSSGQSVKNSGNNTGCAIDTCGESTERFSWTFPMWSFVPDYLVDADIEDWQVTNAEIVGSVSDAKLEIEYEVEYNE